MLKNSNRLPWLGLGLLLGYAAATIRVVSPSPATPKQTEAAALRPDRPARQLARADGDLPTTRNGLYATVLDHEKSYWARVYGETLGVHTERKHGRLGLHGQDRAAARVQHSLS